MTFNNIQAASPICFLIRASDWSWRTREITFRWTMIYQRKIISLYPLHLVRASSSRYIYIYGREFSSQLEQLSSALIFFFFFFHAKGWPIYKTGIVLFSGWPWERLIMRVNDFIAFETGLQARGSASKRGRNYRSSRQRRSTDPGRDKSS